MAYGFEYNHPGTLAKYLDCVRAVVDETPMRISKDGIHFSVMDYAHISMITMDLPVETFGIDETEKITINFPDFWGIFEHIADEPANEKITLSCEGGKATWTLRRRAGMIDVTRAITVPIIDEVEDEVPEPKLPYKNEVVVPSATLLRELMEFEKHIHTTIFIMAGEALVLYSEKDASGGKAVKRNIIKCRAGESPAFKVIRNEDDSVATYTTDFLLPYVTALSKLFQTIILGWSEDMVLHIRGVINEPTLVRYLIAPNVGVTPKVEAVKKTE